MILNIIFADGEDPKDVNELHISAAIYDVCGQLPNIDMNAVGYMLLAQRAINGLKHERMMNEPCQAAKED